MADQLTNRTTNAPAKKLVDLIEPLSDKVIVRHIKTSERKVGLIVMPETAKDKEFACTVEILAVGAGRRFGNGDFQATKVKPGDICLAPKSAGFDIKIEGETYKLMQETDLIGIFKDTFQEP